MNSLNYVSSSLDHNEPQYLILQTKKKNSVLSIVYNVDQQVGYNVLKRKDGFTTIIVSILSSYLCFVNK